MIKCIIVGSGPSGLMAANVLEENNINYLLLEKNKSTGKKLLITGGTRCNVTNKYDVTDFIDHLKIKNKRFLYSTLSNFGTNEVKEFFNKNEVELALEKEYQYFPKSSKSSDILGALLKAIDKTRIKLNTNVISITKKTDYYIVKTNEKEYLTENIIIATGSKSFPKTGSTGDAVIWGKELKHKIIPFYPAETSVYSQFVKRNKEYLQGITLNNCEVSINNQKKKHIGGLIFTHYGISGPVIQNISELIYLELSKVNVELLIKLTNYNETEILSLFEINENQNKRIIRIFEKLTIKRLAKFLLLVLKLDENMLVASLSKQDKQMIIQKLLRFNVKIDKVESIENAFVNGGGIDTSQINPSTMESKISKGLFFIGEALNVHGPIGGFNITIALSTGYTAASNIGGYKDA